jgi:3-deoxy-D-manno-octulosonate 8-phosphate phosphatase (KDO 8-P phosphatase)
MGVSLGRRAGLMFALISGESDTTLDHIAARFGIDQVIRGCKDKAAAVRDVASSQGIDLADICFIGDDINDVPAMRICGLSAAPSDAHPEAIGVASLVTHRSAGGGAVREVIDDLLSADPGAASQSA